MNRNTDEKRKFLISYAYFAVIIATGLFLLKYAVKLILPFLISFGVSFLQIHLRSSHVLLPGT